MSRNLINTAKHDSEPMLGEVTRSPRLALQVCAAPARSPFARRAPQPTWLPEYARIEPSLDTNTWLTRAARGLSWNRGGKPPRLAH